MKFAPGDKTVSRLAFLGQNPMSSKTIKFFQQVKPLHLKRHFDNMKTIMTTPNQKIYLVFFLSLTILRKPKIKFLLEILILRTHVSLLVKSIFGHNSYLIIASIPISFISV